MVLEIEDSTSFDDFLIKTDELTFLDFPFFVNMNLYKQEVINRFTTIWSFQMYYSVNIIFYKSLFS